MDDTRNLSKPPNARVMMAHNIINKTMSQNTIVISTKFYSFWWLSFKHFTYYLIRSL